MNRILNKSGKFVAGFVLLFITGLLGWKVIKNVSKEFMPVRYVRVSGIFQHISKEEIQQVVEPLVSTDFVSADLQLIHDAALSLPWVARARVKRIWPDVINIRITEQQAVFRWGEDGLLNMQGELFNPREIGEFSSLAVIQGPQEYEFRLFNIMQELRAELAEQSLQIKELNVNERRSWKIVLGTGMQLQLGRREPAKNFRRFVKTLHVLGQERLEVIENVDMRYPDGYSITWKSGASPDLKDTGIKRKT